MQNSFEVAGGYSIAGFDIGIITLKTRHPLLPGNIQNARSFNTPVLYEVLDVSDIGRLMMGDEALTPQIVAAAKKLQSSGVRAVVGACGSFAYYQREVAMALKIPVYMSIMVQCSFILDGLGPYKKLCVIFASANALTDRLLASCGISDPSRLVVRELRGKPEFDKILAGQEAFCPRRMEQEVIDVAKGAVMEDSDIGAFLIQCSDLPPFSHAVEVATGRPVFDMVMLIKWLQSAVRKPAVDIY